MCCPNVGAKFRIHHLSQMMPSLGGVFFIPWDKVTVVHNLTGWIWKDFCASCCLLHEKGEISQNDLM